MWGIGEYSFFPTKVISVFYALITDVHTKNVVDYMNIGFT